MTIDKNISIDLARVQPHRIVKIHEGDVNSVFIVLTVTNLGASVSLTGLTIKYDAVINNYLAEQDANGSVVDNKISIPVTQNMTAMSGLLLIDVRMIQNDQILFTQTICATVEKAVVNGSTYIDFSKVTIIQRMNALEDKMDYIEELVEDFDTSKLIVSTERPPMGAPAEVDVDLLRVGDTWVQQGSNIVYRLTEAQYNYQPAPSAEPYHKFTWQPQNERYSVGNTEPPATETYQPIVYTVSEVTWSWLPVPEWFMGDHYQMLVDGESTYYICKSGTMASTGVCTYTWREDGGGASSSITIINTETVPESANWDDEIPTTYAGQTGEEGELALWNGELWYLYNVATLGQTTYYHWDKVAVTEDLEAKMDLAPLNPTAEQIAALPSGQLYSDTANHKGVVKGGQEFYDTNYIDEYYRRVFESEYLPPNTVVNGDLGLKIGDIWVYNPPHTTDDRVYRRAYILNNIERTGIYGVDRSYTWEPTKYHYIYKRTLPDQEEGVGQYYTIGKTTCFCYAIPKFSINDKFRISSNGVEKTYIVTDVRSLQTGDFRYFFDQLLTPDTLPIYDGTVI